jgi:hypothetical protein
MVFFAIIGALFGAIESTMIYAEVDWFGGYRADGFDGLGYGGDNAITGGETGAFDIQGNISSETMAYQEFSGISVIGNMIKRVFWIADILAINFAVYDSSGTVNLFKPFAYIIQMCIWIIYSIGFFQIWRKFDASGSY